MVAAIASPCAISRAVAVRRPDRFICHDNWSITQPAYIANRGTSGMATSMAMEGSVQFPDWKLWVLGVVPVVVGAPKAAFSQKPNASASSGTTTSPSAVTASLIGASGSRP